MDYRIKIPQELIKKVEKRAVEIGFFSDEIDFIADAARRMAIKGKKEAIENRTNIDKLFEISHEKSKKVINEHPEKIGSEISIVNMSISSLSLLSWMVLKPHLPRNPRVPSNFFLVENIKKFRSALAT